MPGWVIDIVILLLIALMTYALAAEGLWGSALMFFNILFSAMIAFNCYEWPAKQMASNTPELAAGFADSLCLMGIFVITLIIFRLITSSVAPNMVRFPIALFHIGRLAFAFGGASLVAAMILMAFYVSPVQKKVFGSITYKTAPPFGLGVDHKWLGFFQYSTAKIFARYDSGSRDPFQEYGRSGGGNVPVRMFDPEGRWLLDHETARPFGSGFMDEILKDIEGEAGGGAAAQGAGGAGGAPAPGNSGGPAAGRQ